MRFLPLLAIAITVAPLFAQVDVDKTCATCDRRQLDSLNLLPRAIRVNQVGYLPTDPNKAAFVANPAAQQFSVVDARTRKAVFTGPLKSSGTFTEGAMRIRGGYNSIIDLYNFSRPASAVALHRADFSAFTAPGEFVLACGKDTSAAFRIDSRTYNQVFETSLKFFGSNRCGNTHSWIHKACHLKDGDALGAARAGSLAGGWHDCGDHGKYSETVAYAAVALAATYAFWPEKGEDFYGKSYNDTLPFGTDGVPDVLYEAKIGADYILNLYKASVADGLIAKGDMYHSVGMGPGMDHQYWDVPDHQDVQPQSKGGPARPVTAGIGSNVAGMYAAALAFFAWGWEPFDPAYAKECLAAATVLYDKIVMARRGTSTKMPCCYTGGGPTVDDEGLAAMALWFATKEKRFGFDLIGNPALGTSGTAQFNQGEFPTGIMAKVPYHHGGWTTDYQNTYAYVLYGLAKLIVNTPAHAAPYGIDAATADSLKRDALAALRNSITIGSNGSTTLPSGIRADPPYNGVFTSADWGFNRYNLGLVTEIFMYWDLTKDKDFYNIGVDNLNYNLGMNPWDISFVMGAGEKNLQHPHNRAANPEGYNAGGLPYKYQSPKGALMGGCRPGDVLIDDWEKYVNTETCIDFSAQLLIPAQLLAQDLPPDTEGPKFRNVNIFPEERSALVTWATDEISRDSVYLLDAPGGRVLQALPGSGLAKAKQANFAGLTPNTTYWIYFKGEDIRRNVTVDRNGGEYWKFTTKASAVAAQISDIRVCNETHESALVTWWTRNGEYQSQVDYGKTIALGLSQSPDDMGVPTRFHRVTLRELEPATQYFFQTVSGATKDDNGGRMHTLKTTQVLVDYTIRIKPTNKASGGKSAHFYLDVTNHEGKAYTGLELRVYFSADAATAADLVAQGFDNQVFDVGGVPSMLDIAYGKAAPVPGMAGIWYFPITLKSTLPVAGRARFELQVNRSANGGFALAPFSLFKDAWSLRAHTAPPDPVAFEGVDLSKGENGVYIGPEMVEKVNGENVLTYQEDPFITAYYQGVHVYGYGPDYLSDPLVYQRTMHLELTAPVASPLDRLDLRRETDTVTLAGKAWVDPDGRVDKLIINGVDLEEARLTRTGGRVIFTFPAKLQEGANTFDIIAWDTAHCAVESRKLIVNWKKGPPIPPAQAAKPKADPPGRAGRDSVVVGLTSGTAGAAIWYSLDGSVPGAGAPGSVLYAGPIVIKSQATLKAIAVAPGFSPSEIMVETYDVFPFRVANVAAVTARDGDGDGHADFVEALLDTALGAPAAAVAGPQADAARFNNGFAAAGSRLAADSLRILLATNTVRVRDGRDSLTLPPPATLQDGMLRPGNYPIRDGIAPVLRKAVLLRGLGGAPDTLLAVFSEPLRADRLGPKPLAGLRVGEDAAYTFGLGPLQTISLPGTAAGEQAYRSVILSVAGPSGAVVPLAGDWVRIDPAGGASDSLGNAQLHPLNAKVPLQIRIALTYTIRLAAADGITRPGTEAPKAEWSADGGPNVGPVIGEPGASLPTIRADGGPGALVVESTIPFSIHLRVHSTLGEYLSQARLKVGERDFALLPAGSSPGSRKLVLIWNGKAANGQMAGTGAYVHVWHLTFFPADEAPRRSEGKATFGLLR